MGPDREFNEEKEIVAKSEERRRGMLPSTQVSLERYVYRRLNVSKYSQRCLMSDLVFIHTYRPPYTYIKLCGITSPFLFPKPQFF